MPKEIQPVQMHTMEQLLAPLGITSQHKGLYVTSFSPGDIEVPILHPFRSDHFSFTLVHEGDFSIKVGLLEYSVKKNNVLMIAPNTVRQFLDVSPNCRLTSVIFTSAYLSATSIHTKNVDAFDFLSSQVSPLLVIDEKSMAPLTSILDILESKMDIRNDLAFQDEVLLNLFTGFIYEISALFKQQQQIGEVKGTRKEELTFRFLKILPHHFKEERSVQAYAAMLNITPKYLSQTVKEITGKTAGEFIDEIVMMEAKVALNDPALTVAQVAAYLNFADQFFFSKFFKKQCGISPSKYRQMP
ncbi:helix-turn-helix domain-containing protein [Mucilaginibacter sp. cycad4]|uniref:helix-turn-helix domain-containing protein n=1 Tax=Mucilaginibacter sp. cycad4 TaxID=3342096 RepID=UPI002AAB069B|nr:helix-turn-helix domain-containing protein [Mucilaginibacter gossypii]WPV01403.1 helix-turn-helix domain-containing protein [Mucilaginibacter gossypii]